MTETSPKSVRINCTKGRYDMCSADYSWRLELRTPYGTAREFFDEEPDFWDGVEDALTLIESRVKSYFYTSRRDETLAACSAIRERLIECELLHTEAQIAIAEKRLHDAEKHLQSLRGTAAYLRSEVEAA